MIAAAKAPSAADRPVRDADPERNAAYWARIDAIVAAAPELSTAQRIKLRGIFQQADRQEAAA